MLPWILTLGPLVLIAYTYVGYPALLATLAGRKARRAPAALPGSPDDWPSISITVPAFNEAEQIRGTLDALLALDYPAERRQILVISDASTDATDEIVAGYAPRGVELLRLPKRGGKGAAERAAAPLLRGDIIVNTDAAIRIHPHALKRLVACFRDPGVGVASGRDISVARIGDDANRGESGYVGYEMWIRGLETRVGGIIGASGCFYAIRAHLHRAPLPGSLSRDFAACMIAREHGYRAVSVDEATCLVPRTPSLAREYPRKVRTITRGMETLWHKRHLLSPARHGLFAWMLFSHKVCRWLVPWTLPLVAVGLALLGGGTAWARVLLVLGTGGAGWAALGWALASRGRRVPRSLAVPGFVLAGNVAAVHATLRALRGDNDSIWEPTRRHTVAAG